MPLLEAHHEILLASYALTAWGGGHKEIAGIVKFVGLDAQFVPALGKANRVYRLAPMS
jgi:hypothetical protein